MTKAKIPQAGVFTLSLDLELSWGVRDKRTLQQYRPNLEGVRSAIPALLDRFERYGIHATWATVGMVFFSSKEELLRSLPARAPKYKDARLDNIAHVAGIGRNEKEDPYHFGESLVRMIAQRRGQEVASHTFSHFCCLEPGQTREDFASDLAAARAAARRLGVEVTSLVFPRNQLNPAYLDVCREQGFTAVRGNERHWIYAPHPGSEEALLRRVLRLADSYVNLTGANVYELPRPGDPQPVNVPASRFLRPYSPRLAVLDPLKLWRIKRAMTHAARTGKLFHLWWHPCNFGTHLEQNLAMLRAILRHFRKLHFHWGMRSLNMSEVAALAVTQPEYVYAGQDRSPSGA